MSSSPQRGSSTSCAVTVSPTPLGGDARRIVIGAPLRQPVPLTLAHVAEEHGFLFLGYQRCP